MSITLENLPRQHPLKKPTGIRIAKLLGSERIKDRISDTILQIAFKKTTKNTFVNLNESLEGLIEDLEAKGESSKIIKKHIYNLLDRGYDYFSQNAEDFERIFIHSSPSQKVQELLGTYVDEKNTTPLSTNELRLRTIYHLRILGIQSNLEWIENPWKNGWENEEDVKGNKKPDDLKEIGDEFVTLCDNFETTLDEFSSNPNAETMSILLTNGSRLIGIARTLGLTLSTKKTCEDGRKITYNMSGYISNQLEFIKNSLLITRSSLSQENTQFMETLNELIEKISYIYAISLINYAHLGRFQTKEEGEECRSRLNKGAIVLAEIDTLDWEKRYSRIFHVNNAYIKGIQEIKGISLTSDSQSKEINLTAIKKQEDALLDNFAEYHKRKLDPNSPGKFEYYIASGWKGYKNCSGNEAPSGADLFVQYCIDRLESTEALEKTNNLNDGEKDVLRTLLIFNHYTRSIRISLISELISAIIDSLSAQSLAQENPETDSMTLKSKNGRSKKEITITDIEVLIYALDSLSTHSKPREVPSGENKNLVHSVLINKILSTDSILISQKIETTVEKLGKFIQYFSSSLTPAPAYFRLHLGIAQFIAKNHNLKDQNYLDMVLWHIVQYETFYSGTEQKIRDQDIFSEIYKKFCSDRHMDPLNENSKDFWDEKINHIKIQKDVQLESEINLITTDSADEENQSPISNEGKLEQLLCDRIANEMFLGSCEISIFTNPKDPIIKKRQATEFIETMEISGYMIVFRGNKASFPIFNKKFNEKQAFIKNQFGSIIHHRIIPALQRHHNWIATHDEITKLPNLKALQQKLNSQPEAPTTLIYIQVHSSADLENPELKIIISESIKKRLLGFFGESIFDSKTPTLLYQIDGRTMAIDISAINKDANIALEAIQYLQAHPIDELSSAQCVYGFTRNCPAKNAIKRASIAIDYMSHNSNASFHETTQEDIEWANTEIHLIKLIKEFVRDPENVQPHHQAIADLSISTEDALKAKKIEILFGMKTDCSLAAFVRNYNSEIISRKKIGNTIGTEVILKIATACGEYTKITQLIIEASLKQLQTKTEEIGIDFLPNSPTKRVLTRPDDGYEFSINISSEDLLDKNFAKNTISKLKKYGYISRHSIRRVAWEIVESPLDLSNEVIVKNLLDLKEFGCVFAIDDFGQEHSNHSRNTQLGELLGYVSSNSDGALAFIKIDKFFIPGIHKKTSAQASVLGMIAQAKVQWGEQNYMNHIVVEGIEKDHDEELEWFRKQGLIYIQGWRFSKPSQLACNGDMENACHGSDKCDHYPWCKKRVG